MNVSIIFGILSMILFGIINTISRIPANKIGGAKTIFYRNLVVIPILVLAVVIFGYTFSLKYILIGIVIGIFGYIPVALFLKSLDFGKIGVVVPIANSSIAITILLSAIFFAEPIHFTQYLAFSMILIGVILLSFHYEDFNIMSKRAIILAVFACIFWGIIFFLYKYPVIVIGAYMTTLVTEIGVFIASAIHIYQTKQGFGINDYKVNKYIIILGILCALAMLFYNLGLQNGYTSVVVALYGSNPVIATILASYFYDERLELKELIGLIIVIASVIMLSI